MFDEHYWGVIVYQAGLTGWAWHYFAAGSSTGERFFVGCMGAVVVAWVTMLLCEAAERAYGGGLRFTLLVIILLFLFEAVISVLTYHGLLHAALVQAIGWPPAAAVIGGSTTVAALVLTISEAASAYASRVYRRADTRSADTRTVATTKAIGSAVPVVIDSAPGE
jgi:membrane protein implicated in regulation of membrane protease activity